MRRAGLDLAREVRAAIEALSIAFFPPRCGACREPLAIRPRHGLCDLCHELLEPNLTARCPRCDLPDSDGLCAACRADPPPFAALRAPYVYGGPIADLVVAAKFRAREDLAVALAHLMLEDDELAQLAEGACALVPVPLGRRRARQRGYNQAAILARTLGRALHLPVLHLLRRTRDTAPQSDLPLAARHENVHGAFVARDLSTRGDLSTRDLSTRNMAPPASSDLSTGNMTPPGDLSTGNMTPPASELSTSSELSTRNMTPPRKLVLVDDVVTSSTTVREAAAALIRAGADEVVVLAAARASLPASPGPASER